jgi:catecholate siderophore receptor
VEFGKPAQLPWASQPFFGWYFIRKLIVELFQEKQTKLFFLHSNKVHTTKFFFNVRARFRNYQFPLRAELFSILICFGVTAMVATYDVLAEQKIHSVTNKGEQKYDLSAETLYDVFAGSSSDSRMEGHTINIPAGSLKDALDSFIKQTGTNVSYDYSKIEGIKTKGLKGKFLPKEGLDRILAKSGLHAVLQVDGYILKEFQTFSSKNQTTKKPVILPMVEVAADKEVAYLTPRTTTAMKTDTLLRDTPHSVTVINQKQLQDQNPLSMTDAVRYVPGVGISTGEGNRDAIVFRGNRSTGDFYIDGARDDVQHFRDFYNIERIDVMRGPAGLIFGRGGSGGAINRVRKEASWDPVQQVRFSGGSYNHKRVTTDFGLALNDKVAFRLNGLYEHSESFRKGYEQQRYGLTPTVTVKPTKDTKVVFHAELFKDDRIADRGIPSFFGRPLKLVKRSTFFGGPAARSPTDTNKKALSLLVDHKFNNNVRVRNRTHYAIFDKKYRNIFANGSPSPVTGLVALGAYDDETDVENFFNQTDLLLNFDTWIFKHKMVTGVEIGRQVVDNVRLRGHFNGLTTSTMVPASNPIFGGLIGFFNRGLADTNNHVQNSTVSVYMQDQIEILPQLHAVAGVRYNRFHTDFRRHDALSPNLEARNNLVDPRFGLILKPIEQVSIYGSYSMSHQPRVGDNFKGISVTNATLSPERFINIEGGVKVDVQPNLAFELAFFQLDRTNVILPTGVPGVNFLGRGSRVRGVETGLNGQITEDWSIIASYAYQEGILKNAMRSTLGELPKHTYAIWNRYNLTPWFGAAFGVIGRTEMFTTTTNAVTLPGYARVDAAIYARINKYVRAQVNIENVFDVNYFVAAHNDNNIMPGSPIRAVASLVFSLPDAGKIDDLGSLFN